MKTIMTRAWEIVRNAVAKFGGKAKQYIALAMKMAWGESKNSNSEIEKVLEFDGGKTSYLQDMLNRYGVEKFKTWEGNSKKTCNVYSIVQDFLKNKNKSTETAKVQLPKGVVVAKYDGKDAESGELFFAGDWIQNIPGLGWVRADNC